MGSMNTLNESIRKESFAHRHLPNATQQDCSVGGHILTKKRCGKCKKLKAASEFYKRRAKMDGLRSACKSCNNEARNAHRKTPAGREQRRRLAKRRYHQHRYILLQQISARQKVRSAINNGAMLPASALRCIECARTSHYWHHHMGYTKEHVFDVIPVCRICHQQLHAHMPSALKG